MFGSFNVRLVAVLSGLVLLAAPAAAVSAGVSPFGGSTQLSANDGFCCG